MTTPEGARLQLITQDYEILKKQFWEIKDNLQNYPGLEGFGCSIGESKDLSIGISTPFDATILISFSTILLESSELRGKLTIEKPVEDKEKKNEIIWELYFDNRSNLYENLENLKDHKSHHNLTDQGYLRYFFTTLLNKFIDKCFKS